MKIEYRKLIDSDAAPWQQLTNIDELVWNGVYTMRVSDDDGTSHLPCSLANEDIVTIVVKDHAPNSMLQHGRTTMQEITKVERGTGSVFIYSRTCSNVNGMPVWTKWSCKENRVKWESMSLIDKFATAGVYNIAGERTNTADGLPINNTGRISARLVVIDCDNCVTQVLTLLNAGGGDSNIYIRTKQGNAWSIWGKLQTNIEVGAIGLGQSRSFNDLTDNGIYSGANVYATGTDANGYPVTSYETFVLVVINAYLTGGGVTQLKYSLLLNGTTSVTTRTMLHGEWGTWVDLGAAKTSDIQDGSITAQKLAADVRTKVDNPLRPLYIAAGAAYNENTGLYSLNGVEGLTEREMMVSYNLKDIVYKLNIPRIAQSVADLRAIFPIRNMRQTAQILGKSKFNASFSFYGTTLEVFRVNSQVDIDSNSLEEALPCEGHFSGVFNNCTKLSKVYPLDFSGVTSLWNSFESCSSLEEIRIMKLCNNLNIQDSPSVSKTSMLYIVNNATPTTTITITLHHDAYTRLADDTEILSALTKQPLITLVSA